MKKPKARHRLHATKVDRIAIVDRPAVPDAQIVVFKRYKEAGTVFEKQYNTYCDKMKSEEVQEKGWYGSLKTGFVIRSSQVAVDVLQEEVWEALYSEDNQKDAIAKINQAFADFETILVDVLANVIDTEKSETDTQKLTKKDVVDSFVRGLKLSVISESMTHLKNHISFLLVYDRDMEDPTGTIKAVVKEVKTFIVDNITEIVKKIKDEGEPIFEKAGRIISSARLKRIRQAVDVLSEIIEEADARNSEKSQTEEAVDMEGIEKLEKKVEDLTATVTEVVGVLKEKKFLLTEEEKETVKAEKKAKDDQTKAEAEKTKKEDKETLEAKEKKVKADAEKSKKEAEDKTEVEKKEKDEVNKKLDDITEQLAGFDKFKTSISKALGVKTSVEGEVEETEETETEKKGDPFGDVLKGRKPEGKK